MVTGQYVASCLFFSIQFKRFALNCVQQHFLRIIVQIKKLPLLHTLWHNQMLPCTTKYKHTCFIDRNKENNNKYIDGLAIGQSKVFIIKL